MAHPFEGAELIGKDTNFLINRANRFAQFLKICEIFTLGQ